MLEPGNTASDYCERINDGFWAEPVNAVTNLAFIIAALVLLYHFKRSRLSAIKTFDIVLLIILLLAIGSGSFLWHTLATPWAVWADIVPILLFISLYLLSFLIRIAEAGIIRIIFWFVLYHLCNNGLQALFPADTLNGSIFYLPTLATLLLMGLYTRLKQHPQAHTMLLAGGLFTVSIFFRTVDFALCSIWSTGTHFIWHILNACVLYILTMALIITTRLKQERE